MKCYIVPKGTYGHLITKTESGYEKREWITRKEMTFEREDLLADQVSLANTRFYRRELTADQKYLESEFGTFTPGMMAFNEPEAFTGESMRKYVLVVPVMQVEFLG